MRGIKLRILVGWMALVSLAASVLLCVVWKEHEFVRLSRVVLRTQKEAARLQDGVLVLETEVQSLRKPSRLEELARERFGLINPGSPIVVQPEGQVLARGSKPELVSANGTVKTAGWRGRLPW